MSTVPQLSVNQVAVLKEIAGEDHVFTRAEDLKLFSQDETEDLCFLPDIVIEPHSTKEISALLKWASEQQIPVTPRAGGTGLSGGALPIHGGMVLSLKRLNQILEIDRQNLMAVIQPGVITQIFQEAVEAQGLFYPPDPASRGSCHLGGNLGHCAGGPRAVKYGVTRDYILGIEAVLPNGEIIRHGGKLIKNSTGYNLTQLLIGSEGTLAVITELTVKLLTLPKLRLSLSAPFADLESAARVVSKIFHAKIMPSALEFMEMEAVQLTEQYLGMEYPYHECAAHLLMELDGNEQEEIDKQLQILGKILLQNGAQDVLIANSEERQQDLWKMRRAIGEAVRSNSVYKEEDTVVPRSELPALIRGVKEICKRYDIRSICYGHAGDGNIHVNVLKDQMPETKWREILPQAITDIFQLTVSLGGTISGEHGIGFSQKNFLPIACSLSEISLMRRIKQAFDPHDILNPGKIF